jgi:hypothetical protein
MIGAATTGFSLFGDDAEPSADTELVVALEVVRNERRRLIIRTVADLEPGELIRARELAHQIAAIEEDADPAMLSWSDSKSAYVALTQRHLEQVESAGAIIVDESGRDRRVTAGPALEAFVALLDDAAEYFERGDE